MAKRLVNLEFKKIDEGKMEQDLNEDMTLMQKELLAFKKKYGADSIGCKAVLTMKLTLKLEEDQLCSIKGAITRSLPSRPARVTKAFEDNEQDGTPTLFVRHAGSSHDTPEQKLLDEELDVDKETGL